MDCILLDTDNYNPNTHAWNAPILALPRVKCVNLYIDGREVSQNEYNVKKNYIYISEKNTVTAHTKAYVMIDVSSGPSILVKFWLPIILGLLTAFSPLIAGLRGIWPTSNSMLTYWFYPKGMNYNKVDSNLIFNIAIENRGFAMTPEQTNNYELILFMKGAGNENLSDPTNETFECLSEPFKLHKYASGHVKPDRNLMDSILGKHHGLVQVVMVIIRREKIQEAKENRTLRTIPKEDYIIVRNTLFDILNGKILTI